MTKIYQVQSNIKHDGIEFKKDSFVNANDSQFASLESDGIFKLIEGAETEEEAKKIVAGEKEIEASEKESEAVLPNNTWEAKKEDTSPEKTDDEVKTDDETLKDYDGPMGQYKITGVAPYSDEKGEPAGELEIGSVQTLPKEVGDGFVADGVAEEVTGDEVATPENNAGNVSDDGANL